MSTFNSTSTNSQEGLHVIFGSGPVGATVARLLHERGRKVRVINRSGKADVPAAVEVVRADAYDVGQAVSAAQDAAVIYQASQPGYTEWAEKFPPLQASILEAAAQLGAKFIVVDNLYMYPDTAEPLREDMPYTTHTKKGRVRAQMAQTVLNAHKAGKVRAAIARASTFYGPRVLGSALGERLFKPLIAGKKAEVYLNPDIPHTYSYIGDFAHTLMTLGERDEALGEVWHVPNDVPTTQRQIVKIAAEIAGVAPQMDNVGLLKLRIGGLFIPEAREMIEMRYEFEKAYLIDDGKYRHAFPDTLIPGVFPMPLRAGLEKTVAWYKQHSGE